jgi:hypothetical protein
MAAGVPVIGSDVGGIPYLIRVGENGFVVPVGDVSALDARLRQLLSASELRMRMGARGRELAHTNYSEKAYDRARIDPGIDAVNRATDRIHVQRRPFCYNRSRRRQPPSNLWTNSWTITSTPKSPTFSISRDFVPADRPDPGAAALVSPPCASPISSIDRHFALATTDFATAAC